MAASEVTGFVASALVLLTFAMSNMRALRFTAILSNVAFITYAAIHLLMPVLLLHLLLLPINVMHLARLYLRESHAPHHSCRVGEGSTNGDAGDPAVCHRPIKTAPFCHPLAAVYRADN